MPFRRWLARTVALQGGAVQGPSCQSGARAACAACGGAPAGAADPRAGAQRRRTCACVVSMVSMVMVKMECERDESWFMSVAPTERFFLPTCTPMGPRGEHNESAVRAEASPHV
jgi:hypothetical protein